MAGELRVKGFVFSLDALFAVFVAVTAVAAAASVMGTTESQSYGNMPLQRAAQDALTLMDKQGFLRNMLNQSDAQVQASLDSDFPSYVPNYMGASINITICDYNDPGFTCSRNFFKQVGGSPGQHVSGARRVFVDPAKNQFGLAVIRVWYS